MEKQTTLPLEYKKHIELLENSWTKLKQGLRALASVGLGVGAFYVLCDIIQPLSNLVKDSLPFSIKEFTPDSATPEKSFVNIQSLTGGITMAVGEILRRIIQVPESNASFARQYFDMSDISRGISNKCLKTEFSKIIKDFLENTLEIQAVIKAEHAKIYGKICKILTAESLNFLDDPTHEKNMIDFELIQYFQQNTENAESILDPYKKKYPKRVADILKTLKEESQKKVKTTRENGHSPNENKTGIPATQPPELS
jgi:hypothetical protein